MSPSFIDRLNMKLFNLARKVYAKSFGLYKYKHPKRYTTSLCLKSPV